MHLRSLDYGSGEFWASLARRLDPVVGDITRLDRSSEWAWQEEFANLSFDRLDFHAVALGDRYGDSAGNMPWWLIELHPAARAIRIDDDALVAAYSLDEAITWASERAFEAGVFPDAMRWHSGFGRLDLTLAGQPFIVIRKFIAARPAEGNPWASRARSTLVGLRKTGDADLELHKRVCRWPGLEALASPGAEAYRRTEPFKLPVPSEWIVSARRLAERLNGGTPTNAQAQNLVAAVFDKPSWHHLLASVDRDALPVCPWWVNDSAELKEPLRIHGSAFDAFADLARLAAERARTWRHPTSVKAFASSSDRPPSLYFVERLTREAFDAGRWPDYHLGMDAIRPAGVAKETVADVRRMLSADVEGATRELFMIGVPPARRHTRLDEGYGRRLVADEGIWRFSVETNGLTTQRLLIAQAIDVAITGNVFESFDVTCMKASLDYYEDLQAYVLSSDRDGFRPVAIIQGISADAVERIRAELSHSLYGPGTRRTLATVDADTARRIEQIKQSIVATGRQSP